MTGNFSKPLDPDEISLFERAATDAEDPIRTLVGHVLLHIGLRNGEFVHMRPGWLSEYNGGILLRIPETAECIGGVGPTGAGNKKQINLNSRGEPCAKCRNKTHRENNRWEVKTPAAVRSIQIDSDQQPLSNLLDWWKQGFDCVPLSHNGVNYHLRQLADEAGLDRTVRAHDLRYTHAVMLRERGWKASQIAERLGYSSIEPIQQFTENAE